MKDSSQAHPAASGASNQLDIMMEVALSLEFTLCPDTGHDNNPNYT